MKTAIRAIVSLMIIGLGHGLLAATPVPDVALLMQSRGDAYLAQRQLFLAETTEDIQGADFGPTKLGALLQETLLSRKASSPSLAALDEVINKDRSRRQSGEIDANALRDSLPQFAPLAGGIAELRASNQTNRMALKDISLGVAEFFLKLTKDEYETYNALCALDMLARYREMDDALLPEVIGIVERTDSARVASQGLQLLQRAGKGGATVETVGKAVTNHKNNKRVRTVCRAILQRRLNDNGAQRLLQDLDQYERDIDAKQKAAAETEENVEVIVNIGGEGKDSVRIITNAPSPTPRP